MVSGLQHDATTTMRYSCFSVLGVECLCTSGHCGLTTLVSFDNKHFLYKAFICPSGELQTSVELHGVNFGAGRLSWTTSSHSIEI